MAAHEEAVHSIHQREERLENVYASIEHGLEVIGATAIEDRLQDGVNETIRFVREAGIKVWMLTGDKVETAVTIGHSSGLLDEDNRMIHFKIIEGSYDAIVGMIRQIKKD